MRRTVRMFLHFVVGAAALLMASGWLTGCSREQAGVEPAGATFGEVSRADLIRLERHAARADLDLFPELQRAQAGDEAALERVFRLSLSFSRFDQNARTYGHILQKSLEPLGRRYGMQRLAQLVAEQPEPVRQRVRDFWLYEATRADEPAAAEERVRRAAPQLFPPHHTFGAGDSLFGRR